MTSWNIYTYFILSMIYLSGTRPSCPRTLPFHQSLETCLNKVIVSPLWKLTSLADLALKSYNAWASKVSDSEKKIVKSLIKPVEMVGFGKYSHKREIICYIYFQTYFQISQGRSLEDHLGRYPLWRRNLRERKENESIEYQKLINGSSMMNNRFIHEQSTR